MTDSVRSRRFVIAGFAAPVVGEIWSGLFFAILMAMSSNAYQWPPTFAFMAAWTSAYSAVIGLLLTWTLGLGWHVLACARGWRSLQAYAGFGNGAGASIASLIYLLSNPTWSAATWLGLLWFSSTGAVIALIGWLIRRPDRDVSANPPRSPS